MIFLCGGKPPGSGVPADVLRYHTTTDLWTSATPMPKQRVQALTERLGPKIYAVGGKKNSEVLQHNEQYDATNDIWTSKSSLPTPRHQAAGGAVGNTLYVAGGRSCDPTVSTSDCTSQITSVEVYDCSTDSWLVRNSMPKATRNHMALAFTDVLYVAGGQGPETAMFEMYGYTITSDTWASKNGMPEKRNRAGLGTADSDTLILTGAIIA